MTGAPFPPIGVRRGVQGWIGTLKVNDWMTAVAGDVPGSARSNTPRIEPRTNPPSTASTWTITVLAEGYECVLFQSICDFSLPAGGALACAP